MAQFSGEDRADGLCIVRAAGDIDIAAAEEFLEVGRDVLSRCTTVEIDLGDVTFIDSSGLGALVRMHKEAADQRVPLSLTNVSAATDRLLQLTGLHSFFDIRTSQT